MHIRKTKLKLTFTHFSDVALMLTGDGRNSQYVRKKNPILTFL